LTGKDKGTAFQLAHLRRARFENVVINPRVSDQTIVLLPDDRFRFGTFFVYVGQKQSTGNAAARAGLVGGDLYALHVENGADDDVFESLQQPFSGRFEMKQLNDVSEIDAMQENALHQRFRSVNGTWFRRPEDVAWHRGAPHRFVLVTTDANRPRIYRFEFDDIDNVQNGGTVQSLLKDVRDDSMKRQATSLDQLGDQLLIGLDHLVLDADGNAIVCEDGGQGLLFCC
jgi:secreted PhoX family phosphatase